MDKIVATTPYPMHPSKNGVFCLTISSVAAVCEQRMNLRHRRSGTLPDVCTYICIHINKVYIGMNWEWVFLGPAADGQAPGHELDWLAGSDRPTRLIDRQAISRSSAVAGATDFWSRRGSCRASRFFGSAELRWFHSSCWFVLLGHHRY